MPPWPYGVVYVGPFWLLLVVFPTLNCYCNIVEIFEPPPSPTLPPSHPPAPLLCYPEISVHLKKSQKP